MGCGAWRGYSAGRRRVRRVAKAAIVANNPVSGPDLSHSDASHPRRSRPAAWPATRRPPCARCACPRSSAALARADTRRVEGAGHEAWLARAFGLADPAPIAAHHARGRRGTAVPARGCAPIPCTCARCATAPRCTMRRSSTSTPRRSRRRSSLRCKRMFSADGLEFSAPAPERWYVRVPDGRVAAHHAARAARWAATSSACLPRGTGRINWRSA